MIEGLVQRVMIKYKYTIRKMVSTTRRQIGSRMNLNNNKTVSIKERMQFGRISSHSKKCRLLGATMLMTIRM